MTMLTVVPNPATRLDAVGQKLAQGLALRDSRTDRRTFLGRFGLTIVGLSLGGAGATLLTSEEALGHSGGCGSCSSCCPGNSVTCKYLTGTNACPAGTIDCGYWEGPSPSGACASGRSRWVDCCGACNDGASCSCYPSGASCCYHKTWANSGVGCGNHIKCRRWVCI